MKVYVKAKSRSEINALLDAGRLVIGVSYSIHGQGEHDLTTLPAGSVIARYTKTVMGNPLADGHHEWNAKRKRLV